MRRILWSMAALCIGLCILFVFSFGEGVLAVWKYAELPLSPSLDDFSMLSLGEFAWKPEDILPGGGSGGGTEIDPGGSGETIDKVGENYLALTESVLWNIKMGLNGDKDSFEQAIKKERVLYSYDNISGGNLKHLFTTNESRALEFVMIYVSDTEFHMYMYEDDRLESGTVGSDSILVYKNVLTYDASTDEWGAARSFVGTAMIRFAPGSTTRRTIDYENFVVAA